MKALKTSGRPARKPAKKPAAGTGKNAVRDLSAHATGTTIAEKADQALRKSAGT